VDAPLERWSERLIMMRSTSLPSPGLSGQRLLGLGLALGLFCNPAARLQAAPPAGPSTGKTAAATATPAAAPASRPSTAVDSVALTYHEQAVILLQRNDETGAREALKWLETGLKKRPKVEPLHRLAGIAAFRLKDTARAEKAFDAAIALEPTVAFNYLKLASLYLCELQKPDKGQAVLTRLFEALPKELGVREEAAVLLARCGSPDGAIDQYLRLSGMSHELSWYFLMKAAQLYHVGGRYPDALKLLKRAVASGPKDRAELPAQLGSTLARTGDKKSAAEQFRKALTLSPEPGLKALLEKELRQAEAH
jgi:tetratricopeptide (TPR) repeat protein